MNYKRRNLIGILSFITIILLMVNFNTILENINYKLLGIKFIGIKEDKLFLSDLNVKELSKEEFAKYIDDNLNKIGKEKLEKFKFSVYVKDVNKQENFIEVFKIPVDFSVRESLYLNVDLIPTNKELLFKFVLQSKEKTYTSNVFSLKIYEEQRQKNNI